MSERTRQRQGRDFDGPEKENPLKSAELAAEANCNMLDGVINNEKAKPDSGENKESVLSLLERFRKEAEAQTPVDGHEPSDRVR
jgi:hypothetical protein